MKLKKIKILIVFVIALSITVIPTFQIINTYYFKNPMVIMNKDKLPQSSDVVNTQQWITNGGFDSPDDWTSIKGMLGDPTDVDAFIGNGMANYEVLGERRTFSLVETPIIGANWEAVPNPNFPHGPTSNFTDSEGLKVYHLFDDHDANQNPSVHWDRNFTMPVDMSDYVITSASIQAEVNATVNRNVDVAGDTIADYYPRSQAPLNQLESYDYVRFYVLLSDLLKNKVYEIAYYQPSNLGQGNPPSTYVAYNSLSDTYLISVPEDVLIFYLTSILSSDNYNFTVTLGIRIYTADNSNTYDYDEFNELLIKSVDLTFAYEKKINQQTSISWNQYGDKPSDISSNPIIINDAILNFKYKVNDTWSSSSPNSEIKIFINKVPHSEVIKLTAATTSFQEAKLGGYNVKSLIDENKDVNVSVQVYLADDFELNRTIAISIDDIYLNITYTEIIEDVETRSELFLNNDNKTLDPVISIPLGENLNITIKYLVNLTGNHIPGALVRLEGKVSGNLTENMQQYTIIINTTNLGIGVKTLTIVAQKVDYVSQNIPFFVEVTERETELLLFLDSVPKNDGDTIQVKVDELINVTINYRDNLTKQFLSGASASLLGIGNLDETNGLYNITINTNTLSKGITAFTIFIQLNNYMPKSVRFYVELIERETELLLFVDSVPKDDKDTIQVQADEFIDITVNYNDDETKQHLSGALVTLLGIESLGVQNLTESINYYNITIDTDDLNPGITVLTIFAQLSNYRAQSIQLFVEIVERETELLLYLDSVPKNDGDMIQVEVNELINVTVYYRDNVTKQLLNGAIISLLGRGLLDEINGRYNITVDTDTLDQGITILTIFAQLDKYQPQSIQFFVEVVERDSNLILFLDDTDITPDPVIEVTIGTKLNMTVFFTDNQTSLHISGATIQLIGEGLIINFTEGFYQYNLTLNTRDLKIGVSLFTIVARANNYQIRTIDLRITTNRIKIIPSTLTGEHYITGLVGDNIPLRIILNDTSVIPFGGLIMNATVTYKWAFGQGFLMDLDNDGIYEIILNNVPSGNYIITVTASAGDDYDFESLEVTLSVSIRSGLDVTWIVYSLVGGIAGIVIAFTLYQTHFKYPPMVRKLRKLRKKVRKGKKLKKIVLNERDNIVKNQIRDKLQILDLVEDENLKNMGSVKKDA